MIAAGLLVEGESHAPRGKPGPRFIALNVAPDGAYVLGLGLEASSQEIGLLTLRGTLKVRRRLRLSKLSDAKGVAEFVAKAVRQLIRDEGVPLERILGMGASVIGIVDPHRGVVLESPYLKWKNVAFGAHLHRATELPVVIDSLLHSLNIAEANHGSQKGLANVIYVHTTLGLGASILASGTLLRGAASAAGQIGHIRVPASFDKEAKPTPLAALSSGRAILRSLKLLPSDGTRWQDYAQALTALQRVLNVANDPNTAEARTVHGAGERLGEYLGGLCGVLNPQRIVLGGLLGRHPQYVGGAAQGIAHQLLVPENYRPALVVSDMDSTRAAALMALDNFILMNGLDLPSLPERTRPSLVTS